MRAFFAALMPLALLACGNGQSSTKPPDAGTTPADAGTTPPDAGTTPADAGTTPPDGEETNNAPVFVHLFEWSWNDIAAECETYLGRAGVAAVQISPPTEHAVLPGPPWYQRYQTVSYSLARSRSGTEEQFRAMVRRCAASGVAIYVDAVINHMTAQPSGVGSNGTSYTKYSYPGLYEAADFRMPPCGIAGTDYQDAPDRVRNCELLGLADLNTSSEPVRDKIAAYLTSLVDAGVRGFRIDAAKHIAPADLDAILRRVDTRVKVSPRPYYFFEVIDNGGEAIRAVDYLNAGPNAAETVDVTEFKYSAVGSAFLNAGGKKPAELRTLGAAGGELLPGDRAVVFVTNHDTERASAIYYQDGAAYDLATVFMLAWPYGYPSILSSYSFDRSTPAGRSNGPPAASPTCAADAMPSAGWLCQHRRPYVEPLIAFRKATAAAPDVTNWWDDGGNQIAFGRGNRGFVVINRGATGLQRTFTTSLPAGRYCDVYRGTPAAGGCAAPIVVDAAGTASLTVAPMSAAILHVGARAP